MEYLSVLSKQNKQKLPTKTIFLHLKQELTLIKELEI